MPFFIMRNLVIVVKVSVFCSFIHLSLVMWVPGKLGYSKFGWGRADQQFDDASHLAVGGTSCSWKVKYNYGDNRIRNVHRCLLLIVFLVV